MNRRQLMGCSLLPFFKTKQVDHELDDIAFLTLHTLENYRRFCPSSHGIDPANIPNYVRLYRDASGRLMVAYVWRTDTHGMMLDAPLPLSVRWGDAKYIARSIMNRIGAKQLVLLK